MFCPSCGAEYAIELNYCNRCGANLSSALGTTTQSVPVSVTKPTLIIGAVLVLMTTVGLAAVLSSAIELTRTAGGGDLSMAVVFFGMITILTVDILLLRLLSKLINAALSAGKALPAKKPSLQSSDQLHLPRPNTARLEPAPSVTENTTRFFEPAYREPVSRDKVEK